MVFTARHVLIVQMMDFYLFKPLVCGHEMVVTVLLRRGITSWCLIEYLQINFFAFIFNSLVKKPYRDEVKLNVLPKLLTSILMLPRALQLCVLF